jgi:phage-related protein
LAGENAVSLEILVQVKDALQQLQTFEKEAARSTGSIESSFNQLKAVGAAALGFLAAGKVKDFFADSIKGAADQEQELTRLATAMKQTGEFSQAALDDFSAFADQLEATSKFSDDAALSQLAVAKSFGLSNDQAKQLVKTAADLASATGESLETAVHQLGITYSGTTGRLGQTIPVLKNLTEEQLKNGEAVKLLGERFKGSAEAEVNTYGGAIQQAGNAFEDFQKAIGGVITGNPVVIAAIKSVTSTFRDLEGWVQANKQGLSDFVSFGIKSLAAVIPATVDGLIFMAKGLETLAQAYLQAYAAALEFAEGAASFLGLDKISSGLGQAKEKLQSFSLSLANGFESAQGVAESLSKALNDGAQAVFDADAKTASSAKASSDQRSGGYQRNTTDLKKLAEDAKKFAEFEKQLYASQADPIKKAEADFKEALEKIEAAQQEGLVSFQRAEELKSVAASTYSDKIIKIHKEEAEKSAQAYASYLQTVGQIGATETEKLQFELDQRLEAIKKFEDAHTITHEQALKAQAAADADYHNKVAQLFADNPFKAALDSALKDFTFDGSTLKSVLGDAIGGAIFDGLKAAKGFIDSNKNAIAAGVGITTDALQGKEGATKLISQGVGALGDAAGIPGLGQLATLLAAGPDAAKAQVKAFIDAIPDIMDAIGEAIPAVVEGFVDEMVNHGGAAKIAEAMVRAMVLEGTFKSLGKQLGINFGDTFTAAKIGPKIASGINDGVAQAGKLTTDNIKKGFHEATNALLIDFPHKVTDYLLIKFPAAVKKAFDDAAKSIGAAFTRAPGQLSAFFLNAVPRAIEGAFTSIRDFFAVDVSGYLKSAGGDLASSFKDGIGDFFSGIRDSLGGVISPVTTALSSFKFPDIPTPAWLSTFTNTVDKLTNAGNPLGKSGIPGTSGNGPVGVIVQSVEDGLSGGTDRLIPGRHARGLTEVPVGFPNDSYPARLTSGERVVDAQTNRDLKAFLANKGDDTALLAQILAALKGGGQPLIVQLKVGERDLSEVILNLNRRNARLA